MILFKFNGKKTLEFFKKYKGFTVAEVLKELEAQHERTLD